MYNLGAIRYILQKIAQVSPCNISKCFIPLEAPVPYIIHSIYYYCCLALLLWQMRHTVHLGLLFQGFHQTRLVPAALMLPSSLNNDGGTLLHSWSPIKSTMSTSDPLAIICVIQRMAATSSLLPGALHFCLDFLDLRFWCERSSV